MSTIKRDLSVFSPFFPIQRYSVVTIY